jgi:type II secretory pathway pseudopilin PulG
MSIAMIIISFLAGTIIASFATNFYRNEIDRQHKADTVKALAQQAEDSFRAGYMRSECNRVALRKRREITIVHETHVMSNA